MNSKRCVVSGAFLCGALLLGGCSNDAAKVELAKDYVRKLNKASEFFFIEKKKCPASANELGRLFTGKDDNDFDFSKDPWGNDFVMYESKENGACYFKSLGSDGKEGGDEHAADITYKMESAE